MPFKCNPENFEKIFQEEYIGKISHESIRNGLKLSDSVRVKLNGGFPRWLYLLDENNCLYRVRYKIKTALWLDKTDKWRYVSIFPNFIKRWYQPCLNLLEYISSEVRRGEDIFEHIDDPEELFHCEDHIAGAVYRLGESCAQIKCEALLNSRYTHVFNRPVPARGFKVNEDKRFKLLYSLIITARFFFGINTGTHALVNSIIHLSTIFVTFVRFCV